MKKGDVVRVTDPGLADPKTRFVVYRVLELNGGETVVEVHELNEGRMFRAFYADEVEVIE